MTAAAGNASRPELLPASALGREELAALVAELGGEPYRAAQVWSELNGGRAASWEEVRGLPGPLRQALAARLPLLGSRLLGVVAAPDGTVKLGLQYPDGQVVEAALIPARRRLTLCLSTQAGCPVGCVFCASGLGGLARSLASWEIVEQALRSQLLSRPEGRLTHLVVMGVGEPLLNLEGLLPALDRLQDPGGLGLGARRIVVSTAGVVPAMDLLAKRRPPVTLAVSLHAADQALRERLVPLALRYTVKEILAAAGRYQAGTGRQVTFEVVLLAGTNDGPAAARSLARLLRGRGFHVNLIPLNPVPELPHRSPAPARVREFAALLLREGVPVTIRRSRGGAGAAACGQLRAGLSRREGT